MGSQQMVNDQATVQFKNGTDRTSSAKIVNPVDIVIGKPICRCGRVYRIARPLRGIEIVILLVLFTATIYLVIVDWLASLGIVSAILLIALFATYLFILGVDMTSQLTGGSLPDTPMFLFAVLGFLLFAAAAQWIYILSDLSKSHPILTVIMALCIIQSILFLVDVIVWVLNWRQTCMRVDGCPFVGMDDNTTTIYQPVRNNYSQRTVGVSDPLVSKADVRDVSTSISDYQRYSHPDLSNLHKFRKIEVGHRREYVDRPVNAQSAAAIRVVEVQTEQPQRKPHADVESLTVAEVREEPAQTSPKCPVCANHWDPHGLRRPENFGLCPTFLHMAQGFGMCNCTQPMPFGHRPILVESRGESTSATDLGVLPSNQRPSRRRSSGPEPK